VDKQTLIRPLLGLNAFKSFVLLEIGSKKIVSAIGATIFKTFVPMGAGLWSKKAHWHGSMPNTYANGHNPNFSKPSH